jgi:hypothetical protein
MFLKAGGTKNARAKLKAPTESIQLVEDNTVSRCAHSVCLGTVSEREDLTDINPCGGSPDHSLDQCNGTELTK